jgi:t-SNARE complex subunit (syntaxin)
MGKLVYESLLEYISHEEDQWADTQLDRWEMEKKGVNPLEQYVQEVAKLIFDGIDEEIIKNSGITDYIIEDLITDDNLMERNAYTFYDEGKPVKAAAFELGLSVENYMMEQM